MLFRYCIFQIELRLEWYWNNIILYSLLACVGCVYITTVFGNVWGHFSKLLFQALFMRYSTYFLKYITVLNVQ